MPLQYLLDTDTCIYLAKNKPPSVMARLARVPADAAAISVITFGELRYGAERSRQRAEAMSRLGEFARAIRVLPIDAEVASAYGEVRASLSRAGLIIGANDLWIAAHALALGVTLVTNNGREFRRVRMLRTENWVD